MKSIFPVSVIALLATLQVGADPPQVESTAQKVVENRFPHIDGMSVWAGYIDMPEHKDGRIFYRYSPIADSGVEIERTGTDGARVWKEYVAPLGVKHSKYRHEVHVYVEKKELIVISLGVQRILERRDMATGKQLTREIADIKR